MIWEALGVGLPVGGAILGFGIKLHTRLAVVETKQEIAEERLERIETKVDDLPVAVANAVRATRR